MSTQSIVRVWKDVPMAQGRDAEDVPDLTIYRPEKPTGAAMIIYPGGGWVQRVAHEKEPVALWMVQHGITAFISSYRVGPRYYHPAPWLDAAESIRLVRARSQEFDIDPRRIGVIGFSAGGHLAAHVSVTYDTPELDKVSAYRSISSRPDLTIAVYPRIDLGGPYARRENQMKLLGDDLSQERLDQVTLSKHVTEQTPPAFLAHSTLDATVPCQESMLYIMALRDHGVPCELHLYERGGHGFGGSPMAPKDPALATWLDHLDVWLKARGF